MNNIKETIRQLAQGGRQSVSLVCTVDAVDKTARTVDCTRWTKARRFWA